MYGIYNVQIVKKLGLYYLYNPLSLSNEKVIEHFFIHKMQLNNCIKQIKTRAQLLSHIPERKKLKGFDKCFKASCL